MPKALYNGIKRLYVKFSNSKLGPGTARTPGIQAVVLVNCISFVCKENGKRSASYLDMKSSLRV